MPNTDGTDPNDPPADAQSVERARQEDHECRLRQTLGRHRGDCPSCARRSAEAAAIVAIVEPAIKAASAKLWAKHPNNPANRKRS